MTANTINASYEIISFNVTVDWDADQSVPSLRTEPAGLEFMYSSTFIFAEGQYDDEFHRLDKAIAEAAKSIPGYMGEESWENQATGLISNVYYWDSLDSLQALMKHPKHLEAKTAQAKWLNGYQVIVSEVLRSYGDGKLSHPVASFTLEKTGRE